MSDGLIQELGVFAVAFSRELRELQSIMGVMVSKPTFSASDWLSLFELQQDFAALNGVAFDARVHGMGTHASKFQSFISSELVAVHAARLYGLDAQIQKLQDIMFSCGRGFHSDREPEGPPEQGYRI